MSDSEHIHTPSKSSNVCTECGELIHVIEKPERSFDPKSLNKTANGLNKVANKIGIALVLVVVGLLLFPLGIILWAIAVGVIINAFSPNNSG